MLKEAIALTGATGFIGRTLLADLRQRGYRVRLLLRRPVSGLPDADSAVIGDLAQPYNLARALEGIDVVVHAAGLAHAMSGQPEDDYRSINTQGTLALAQAARRAGARRFVFLSSVRAQCGPFAEGIVDETQTPQPVDAYGRSKLAAELGLASAGLDWVALRPVLVYGAGVKGNMDQLIGLARLPWPLPLGGLTARRSLLAVENLADAVACVIALPGPIERPFLAADDDALTIAQMIAALRSGLGRRPGLVPIPAATLALAARIAGKAEAFNRLAGSLVVSTAALKSAGWQPTLRTAPALARLAQSPST